MHAKMAYLNGVADTRQRRREMNADMARRDRSSRGKDECLRVQDRQKNRRVRRSERREVTERLLEMEDRLWAVATEERPLPTYRYEHGYRDDHEDCLEFWQDTCNCEECGRYLPVGHVRLESAWGEPYLLSPVGRPIAHVDHDGHVCSGGQDRATSGYLVFDVYDIQAFSSRDEF